MSVAVALAALAWVDCVLSGFRMAAGRNGRLDKNAYYRNAVVRAAIGGAIAVGAHVALVAALCANDAAAWNSFVAAGRLLVAVYGVFATAIFIAFGFYFLPIRDFRVLANVIVFGPLTLARPFFVVGGLALAVGCYPDWRVAVVAASAAVAMSAFEPVLGRRYARLWMRLVPGARESMNSPDNWGS